MVDLMGTTEKKDFLFRFVQSDIRKSLLLDDEALFSTTDQVTADKITRDILKFVPKGATITDATACIGGSTYSFAQNFSNVIAIEYDKTRYEYLQYNMSILPLYPSSQQYSPQQHNLQSNIWTVLSDPKYSISTHVECRNGDALIECTKQFQDAIFIDPPWGGPEYKTLPSVELYLSGLPLSEVCYKFQYYTKYIILKVPVNFDETSFIKNTQTFMDLVYKNGQLRKMHLLIFRAVHMV
jgi:tRNA/tmRNA/rRNA uracil-C5-methylase (TrmA/RlmC/RlmD family)